MRTFANTQNMWWDRHGTHPNSIIPNSSDPIGGGQRWMDTVVRVREAWPGVIQEI